ncbi:phosphate ABC transporter permease subunit PstC [Salsipaludibacter albus]|uniref:phosphate ABC transporter permease subunit PstC n=1 Tax=Salsipaludibacter albus TaxID=2849650 RepID=UPI001EE48BCF|nr:phosphate ABC transporter permease subunit PstC [Salsipaludibacter albus]MBY5162578.1 phosphate ABC transporter permease subunit PstC [Salsipaludibacter albus]
MSSTAPPSDFLRSNRRNAGRERAVTWILRTAGVVSVLISLAIVFSLLGRAVNFLAGLPSLSLLWDAGGWFPGSERFDLRTLLVPTLYVAAIAMLIAVPLGVGSAIYLSEYASRRVRRVLKPILEVLAGIPSVVVGFFALTFITPNIVQAVFDGANIFNMVSAGIAVGVLASPYMASISEDALSSVPQDLREASYGLGARKRRTITSVVLPAGLSGLVAAFILTLSRVIGETMVVTIAAGAAGGTPFQSDPLGPGQTLTAAIANLALGSDSVTVGYQFDSLYFLGLLLFGITLLLNVLGDRIVRRYRKAY